MTRKRAAETAAKPSRRRLPWKKAGLSRLQRVIAFMEWLPVTKGVRAGRKMRLLPDQKEFLAKLYGKGSEARIAIDSKPRGNGKTGMVAGLALCHMLGPESEPRGEIYAASCRPHHVGQAVFRDRGNHLRRARSSPPEPTSSGTKRGSRCWRATAPALSSRAMSSRCPQRPRPGAVALDLRRDRPGRRLRTARQSGNRHGQAQSVARAHHLHPGRKRRSPAIAS